MLLADAIEAWGQAHRAQLDPAAIDKLRKMWATIKRSATAEFDFDQMTKEDARAVMALFPQEQRKDVSDLLNSIRRWSLQLGAVQQGQVQQGQEPAPIVKLQGVATPPGPPAAAAQMPVATIAPRGSQHHQGHGGAPQGPVEPLVAPRTALEGDKPTSSRAVLIGLGVALLVLLAYFLFLRGDDETDVTTSNGEGTELDQAAQLGETANDATGEPAINFGGGDDAADSFTGQGGGDFCSLAGQVEDSDYFESVGAVDAAYFDNIMSLWNQVTAVAPPELAPDVAVMQRALNAYSEAAARVDFNMADPGMVEAFQAIDIAAFETASDNFERYLNDVCGIDTGSDIGGADASAGLRVPTQDGQSSLTEAEGLQILQTFGITPELAECLNAEFVDVDSAMFDPDLFSKPVCGTTLLEVMSGLSG